MNKSELLKTKVEHISFDTFDPVPLVEAMDKMAFQARNTARAAQIFEMMLREKECAVVLCLAGSLISAGLKKIIVQMIENNMVDAIVSTGANIVDQDFFEGIPALWAELLAMPPNKVRKQAETAHLSSNLAPTLPSQRIMLKIEQDMEEEEKKRNSISNPT